MSKIAVTNPNGEEFSVNQEELPNLMRAGFTPKSGQTVTLAGTGHKLRIEDLAGIYQDYGVAPQLENQQAIFERTSEERFGDLGGAALGVGYGALNAIPFGAGGKLMMDAGLVQPETLAQLKQAQPTAVAAGELVGTLAPIVATEGLYGAAAGGAGAAAEAAAPVVAKSLGRRVAEGAAKEAAFGGLYGAGSEATEAGIEGRQANLGEAAATGAGVGAAFGAAFPLLGAGAMAAGRKLGLAKDAEVEAALARAKKGKKGQSTLTPEEAATIREQAETDYETHLGSIKDESSAQYGQIQNAVDALNEIHDSIVASGGPGIKGLSKYIQQQEALLARAGSDLEKIESKKTTQKELREIFENRKRDLTNSRAFADITEEELAAKRQELALADQDLRNAKALGVRNNQWKIAETRVSTLMTDLANMQRIYDLRESLHSATSALVPMVSERASLMAQRGAATKELEQLTKDIAKLEAVTAETSPNVANRMQSATKNAAAQREAKLAERQLLESIGLNPKMSADAAPFARHLMEAVETPALANKALMDAAQIEIARGGQKGLVQEILGQRGVMESMTNPDSVAFAALLLEKGRESLSAAKGAKAKAYDILAGQYQQRLLDLVDSNKTAAKKFLQAAKPAVEKAISVKNVNVLNPQTQREMIEAVRAQLKPIAAAAETVVPRKLTEAEARELVEKKTLQANLQSKIAEADQTLNDVGQRMSEATAKTRENSKILAQAKQDAREGKAISRLGAAIETHNTLADHFAKVDSLKEAARKAGEDVLAAKADDIAVKRIFANASKDLTLAQQEARLAAKDRALDIAGKEVTKRQADVAARIAKLKELQVKVPEAADAINTLKTSGIRFSKDVADANRLVPPSLQMLEEAKTKAFNATPEGKAMLDAMRVFAPNIDKIAENPSLMGAAIGSELMHTLFGGGVGISLVGMFLGAKTGLEGVRKAAQSFLTPVRWYSMTNKVLESMATASVPAGRLLSVHKSYDFRPEESIKYVDAILRDQRAADTAFDHMVSASDVNTAAIAQARERFNQALAFVESKRPPNGITNGSDARAFARTVAVLRNPDLLAKFVKDGTVLPQDAQVMKMVAPEAYEQLKQGVALLHAEHPVVTKAAANAFGIKSGGSSKSMMRISLGMAQMLAQGSPAQQPGGMVAKSETAAAAGRPPSSDSSISKSSSTDTSLFHPPG